MSELKSFPQGGGLDRIFLIREFDPFWAAGSVREDAGAGEVRDCGEEGAGDDARAFDVDADEDVADLDGAGKAEDDENNRPPIEIRKQADGDAEWDGARGVKVGIELFAVCYGLRAGEGAGEGLRQEERRYARERRHECRHQVQGEKNGLGHGFQ